MAKHFKLQPSQKSQTTPQPIEKVATNAWLLERVRYQLGLAESYCLAPQQDLLKLGMDSLQFLDLNGAIQKQFNVKLSAEEAYKAMTVNGFS